MSNDLNREGLACFKPRSLENHGRSAKMRAPVYHSETHVESAELVSTKRARISKTAHDRAGEAKELDWIVRNLMSKL